MHEIFFTPYATENEHYFIQEIVENACKEFGLKMLYYRTFKNGHVPGYRETKVIGESLVNCNKFVKKMEDEAIWDKEKDRLPNRYREIEEYIAEERFKHQSRQFPKALSI